MPKPNVTKEDIDALTTFLLGSTDPSLPQEYMYKPADQRAAIQKGWWIVTKYNCIGCHQIGIGQRSVLMGLPQYQGENKQNLPPVLTSEGARVSPEWLKGVPRQSGAEHHGREPRRRALVPASAHAHVLPVRRRNPHAGARSSRPCPASRSRIFRQKLEPITTAEKEMARRFVHQHRRPLLEVPRDGRSGARQERHRSEFPVRQGSPAAGLDRALDHQSRADRSGNGHALRPFQTRWTTAGSSPARCRQASRGTRAIRRTCWCVICSN